MRSRIPSILLVLSAFPVAAQQAPYTLKVDSNIVLTNVIVRDKKTGAVIKDLKPTDFTILENNKPQKITTFDYQSVDQAALLAEGSTVSGKATIADLLNHDLAADPKDLRDHRLMVFFFDLSSMQPEDIDRAVQSAQDFVNKQMQPADLVAMVSLDTALTMDQDFTANKPALLKALAKYNGTDSTGLAAGGTTGSSSGTADDASSFVRRRQRVRRPQHRPRALRHPADRPLA